MTSQNKSIATGIVIVVLAVIIYAAYSHRHGTTNQASNSNMSAGTNQTAGTQASSTMPSSPASSSSGSSGVSAKLSYGEALNTYKFRIQLLACHGTPGTVNVPKGSPVMFDNRDHNAHIIKVGSQSLSVPGLDYSLLYPASKGNFQVTCDGGGAAQLNVE